MTSHSHDEHEHSGSCCHGHSHEGHKHSHKPAANKLAEHKDCCQTSMKNDNIAVEMHKQPGCRIKLNVLVTPQATAFARKEGVRRVNKEVSLPGFRKGKAPESLVLEHFGKYVNQEWWDALTNMAFRECLDLLGVFPIDNKQVKANGAESATIEKGAELTFEYEHFPEVPSIDPKKLHVKSSHVKPVTEADVDKLVDEVVEYFTEYEKVEGRPAQEGDYVTVDIDTVEESPKSVAKLKRFHLVKGEVGQWLKDLVIGMNIGDEKEGMNGLDPQATDEIKKNFVPALCKVKLKRIQTSVMPELNDELAKKVGAESVSEMRKNLQKKLEKDHEELAQVEELKSLEDSLMEHYSFELPFSFISQEKEGKVKHKIQALKKAGKTKEEISAQQEAIEKEADELSKREISLFFIARKIAQEANIEVTQQDLLDRMQKMFAAGGANPEMMMQVLQGNQQLAQKLSVDALIDKALLHLLSQAKK